MNTNPTGETYRVSYAVCSTFEIHVHAASPEFARGILQPKYLGGLWPKNLAALLAGVLTIAATRLGRGCSCSMAIRIASGDVLKVMDMCLHVVDIP